MSSLLFTASNLNLNKGYTMVLKWFPLFIILFSSVSLADIYYAAPISKSCNPKNPETGSLEDPFKHPHYALYHQKVGCGDTLILRRCLKKRRCLKSLMLGNPSYHQVSHGDVNHRLAALRGG